MTAPGTKVYVSWYGRTLEGEVVEGGMLGMTPVRIPLDGHHPVALFWPEHVYESADQAKMGNLPAISQNESKVDRNLTKISENQSTVDENLTEISESRSKVDSDVVPLIDVWSQEVNRFFTDPVKLFKESHWDEAHNHLRTDCLDEFYQLWLQTHGGKAEAPAITKGYSPITQPYRPITQPYSPEPFRAVPKNDTPDTKPPHKKKPAKAVELSLFD